MQIVKSKKITAATRRVDQLVLALLQHPTIEKAAESVGINPATAWRWMQDLAFQERYREARRQAFGQSVARLQHASGAAVTTLLKIMLDLKAPTHSRVRAAETVIAQTLRAIEMEDIEARLARLEQASLESNENGNPRRKW
jgi:DNA-binding MurR/RpiR family transcriptional regulator